MIDESEVTIERNHDEVMDSIRRCGICKARVDL